MIFYDGQAILISDLFECSSKDVYIETGNSEIADIGKGYLVGIAVGSTTVYTTNAVNNVTINVSVKDVPRTYVANGFLFTASRTLIGDNVESINLTATIIDKNTLHLTYNEFQVEYDDVIYTFPKLDQNILCNLSKSDPSGNITNHFTLTNNTERNDNELMFKSLIIAFGGVNSIKDIQISFWKGLYSIAIFTMQVQV